MRMRLTDGCLRPYDAHAREQLVACRDGEVLAVEIERHRSGASHRHQWAWVHDAWMTIPEALSDQSFARSSEALRKHALIETGFCNIETLTFASAAAAEQAAPFMLRLATQAHGYARAEIDGRTVRVLTPQSQSYQAMGAKRFQESKTAILNWIAALLGVEPEDISQ